MDDMCERDISIRFLNVEAKRGILYEFFCRNCVQVWRIVSVLFMGEFYYIFFSFSVLFPLFVYFIFFLRVDDSLWVWSVWKYLKTNKLWVVCKNKYFLSLSEYFRLKHLKERRENLLFFFFLFVYYLYCVYRFTVKWQGTQNW